ncbi:hypothetical protein EVAR_88246_1 [Eumeta japonica]|uniref:Uncharacterized protein n=1 Tax=Eumeta variegata TaxID=151549 RepID=A0A4C1Z3E5_EUMVA|nr:hypothetical protein EVAR_88246_1 [Eumeta japonica]
MANRFNTKKKTLYEFKKDNRMTRGDEEVVNRENTLSVVKWKNNKGVLMVSTAFEQRHEPSFMGGVDVCDQMMEVYRTWRKTRKWPVKTLWTYWRSDCLLVTTFEWPPRKRPREDLEFAEMPTTSKYRVKSLPTVDRQYDGFNHWPVFDTLKQPRCCRAPGCSSRSRCRCSKNNLLELNNGKDPAVKDLCEMIAADIEKIWNKASIPIISHQQIVARLISYYNKYKNVKKLHNEKKKQMFYEESESKLFDIATCKCESREVSSDEDEDVIFRTEITTQSTEQMRSKLQNLATAFDRTGVSDRSAALIVNAALLDLNVISTENSSKLLLINIFSGILPVQVWLGYQLDPTDWSWKLVDNTLEPIQTFSHLRRKTAKHNCLQLLVRGTQSCEQDVGLLRLDRSVAPTRYTINFYVINASKMNENVFDCCWRRKFRLNYDDEFDSEVENGSPPQKARNFEDEIHSSDSEDDSQSESKDYETNRDS